MREWLVNAHDPDSVPRWIMEYCGKKCRIATFWDGTLAVRLRADARELSLAHDGDRIIETPDGHLQVILQ